MEPVTWRRAILKREGAGVGITPDVDRPALPNGKLCRKKNRNPTTKKTNSKLIEKNTISTTGLISGNVTTKVPAETERRTLNDITATSCNTKHGS